MTARFWQDLTTTDFAALDRERAVALLPVAAIEQHGPHLPLATDAAIAEGVVARAMANAPAEFPLLVLPQIAVGLSPEHGDFAGTLTLSVETLLRMLDEIGESVARAGLWKLVLVNSHGGQPQALDIAAQGLRTRRAMAVVVANTWRLARPDDLVPAAERESGLHGGAAETAMMLHLRPDLVRRERIADFPSAARAMAADLPRLAAGGRVGFAWQTQDLNLSGAVGDARLGDAELGRVLVERAAAGVLGLAEDLSRLPRAALRSGASVGQ